MKKVILSAATLLFIGSSQLAQAQDEKAKEKGKKETQEIVIHKKGDGKEKITVVVDGDNITVNGKPLSEFKDDNITVNKRKMIIRNGAQDMMMFDREMSPLAKIQEFNWKKDGETTKQAFLGVISNETEGGAKIEEVTKGTAAEKAGLKDGDIITKVDDAKVDGPGALSKAIIAHKPKDEVTIYYKREGKENSAKAVLGEKEVQDAMTFSFSGPNGMARSFSLPRTPFAPGNMPPMAKLWNGNNDEMDMGESFDGKNLEKHLLGMMPKHQKLGLKIQDTEDGTGVKVLEVEEGSASEKAGLKKDDVLTEIAGKKITNTDEAREQLHDNAEKNAYMLKAKRNGTEMNFEVKIPKKLKTTDL